MRRLRAISGLAPYRVGHAFLHETGPCHAAQLHRLRIAGLLGVAHALPDETDPCHADQRLRLRIDRLRSAGFLGVAERLLGPKGSRPLLLRFLGLAPCCRLSARFCLAPLLLRFDSIEPLLLASIGTYA